MSGTFDPDAAARPDAGIFGLACDPAQAAVHVLGVPFDATTSYRRGAAHGPDAILRASHQVDLFDLYTGRPYEAGIWMDPLSDAVDAWNREAGALTSDIRGRLDVGETEAELAKAFARVNAIGGELNTWVYERTREKLEAGKLVGLVGGDHATPFGAIRAQAERHPGLGLLHVDAHADLRRAYEGFTWSHASIFHNVLEHVGDVKQLLQVGIRDLCEEEADTIASSKGRIRAVFDKDWFRTKHCGDSLVALVRRELEVLPEKVYVSFDIDGLDPAFCPNTGTPVPGGLSWDEANLWLDELVRSGRTIVGFDVNEVAPGKERPLGEGWDEIVGARLLYRLIGFALASGATSAGAAPRSRS